MWYRRAHPVPLALPLQLATGGIAIAGINRICDHTAQATGYRGTIYIGCETGSPVFGGKPTEPEIVEGVANGSRASTAIAAYGFSLGQFQHRTVRRPCRNLDRSVRCLIPDAPRGERTGGCASSVTEGLSFSLASVHISGV